MTRRVLRYEVPVDVRAFEYRVFGTGQPIKDGRFVGTAVDRRLGLVWHLFARQVAL